jgi:hypothetical protein
MTLLRVPLSWTLFRQSTGCSAAEGLWGTSHRWPGRSRCTPARGGGGAGRTGAGPLYPSATVQLPNPRVWGAKKRGRIGPWGRHRCSLLQPIAVACKAGDVSRRYSSPFLRTGSLRVRGSRRSVAALRRRAKLARDPPQLHQCFRRRHRYLWRLQLCTSSKRFGLDMASAKRQFLISS